MENILKFPNTKLFHNINDILDVYKQVLTLHLDHNKMYEYNQICNDLKQNPSDKHKINKARAIISEFLTCDSWVKINLSRQENIPNNSQTVY